MIRLVRPVITAALIVVALTFGLGAGLFWWYRREERTHQARIAAAKPVPQLEPESEQLPQPWEAGPAG